MIILDNLMNNPGIIFLVIIGIAAVIGITAYVIYRLTHPKLKDEAEKPSEEKTVKEELDRILEPVDDEKTAEDIKNYKSPEDEE